MKNKIAKTLYETLKKLGSKQKIEEIEKNLETPPTPDMGDFAFPCFMLSKELKESPHQIAINIREKIKTLSELESIQTQGPYINFFVDRKILSKNLIAEIKLQKQSYGKIKQSEKIKTMIEFVSPNTNKPLHIGHLRNMAIGESISRICEFSGEKIIRACLNNDRGIHICKSMAAYKLYGKNEKPNIKSDHFVGKYYSMFGKKSEKNKKLELESHHLLQKWEKEDNETLKLWKKMNKWAFEGWEKTYKKFGIKFDIQYYESEIYKKGKEIILQGLKDKIFKQKKDKAIFINLEKEKLGEKILLRSNGTSVYMTQDLYLAKLKFDQHKLNKSYYVVGNEQEYHFNVLFEILKKLGFKNKGLKHFSYGMVTLPDGKIKSREGTKGITTDEIIENIQKLAKKELKQRSKISEKELNNKSLKIALAAIKYSLLKVDVKKGVQFDPKKSATFEGDTGPYILYSYARAGSILKKVKTIPGKNYEIKNLEPKEIELIKKLEIFPELIKKTYSELNPSLIANYAYQLAQIFNEFYHSCPVMNSNQKNFRINIITAFRQVLKNALSLLGIKTLEKM